MLLLNGSGHWNIKAANPIGQKFNTVGQINQNSRFNSAFRFDIIVFLENNHPRI
jgi:hypothetical protein